MLREAVERYSMPYDWGKWLARYQARWGRGDGGSDEDDSSSAAPEVPRPGELAQRKVFLKTGLHYGLNQNRNSMRMSLDVPHTIMPLPVGKVLDTVRDFILPYNIYCPFGDAKLSTWKPLRKSKSQTRLSDYTVVFRKKKQFLSTNSYQYTGVVLILVSVTNNQMFGWQGRHRYLQGGESKDPCVCVRSAVVMTA
jgi:hypothetical protein